MKTNEIFEHVLQIVCEECELCYGELINGANKNAVDARCLLICALVSLGFSEENTAAYLSMTRQGGEQIEKQPETAVLGKFYPVNDKSTGQQQDSHRNPRIATAIAIRLYASDIGRNHQLYLYGKNVCFQSRAQWWRKQVRHHGFIAQPDGR